ncbi:MAG: cytochrome c nitrite reductase small subunit [Gimesia chilikensis]|uniref:cytochrome c nitrite reductase small subunit n=1 Tax=Gimesia chilikensis TaxID=2605989 RepID=UPI003789B044
MQPERSTAENNSTRPWIYGGVSFATVLLCVLLGAVIGTGSYTVQYAEGLSYLSNDPKACVNCHIMRDQYDGWQKASHHANATCNDCHVPHSFIPKYLVKAENGFWHSKGFTLQDFHEPIQMRPISLKILNTNCINCHQELVNDILGHGVAGNESKGCVHCHSSVGHGPQR